MNSLPYKLAQMKIADKAAITPEHFDQQSKQLVEKAKAAMKTLTKKENELEMAC